MSLEECRQLVKRVELFNGLELDDVARIFRKGMTMHASKGQVIFHRDTVGNQMYVVLGGSIGIFDGPKQIATLRTGDMFGEMALVSNEKRSAAAIAVENSKLFVLSETTFQRLLTKRVAVRLLLNILNTTCGRLREANERLTKAGST